MSGQQANLTTGKLYRVRWREHYNRHQVEVGYLGRYLGTERQHCQLHGEYLGTTLRFHRVKESGRLANTAFDVPREAVEITEVPDEQG